MARKKSYITVTDQFCGAGGSSQGVRRLSERSNGGLEVRLALNHWKLAIETHQTNFPDTAHDCTDISACDPRYYDSTDILITSPECTNHSLAKGVKIVKKQMDLFNSGKIDAAAERSRATMWDVCRFAEIHKYNAIIVENVVDARKWVLFDAWLKAMYDLGYLHKTVYLNSMHCHPTPQSRDRMYVVFWKKKNKAPQLDYSPAAYCNKCSKNINAVQTWKKADVKYGKYKQQYVYCCSACTSIVDPYYYAAFNCIDWSDIGTRIADRKKALSDNTIKRIEYGLKKYGREPFIIHRAYGKEARGVWKSVTDPCFTQTSLPSQAVVTPFITLNEHTKTDPQVRAATEVMQTQATRQTMGLVTPFITDGNYDSKPSRSSSVNEEIPTLSTQNRLGIAMPFVTVLRNNSKSLKITEAINTVSAGGIHSGVVTNEAWNSFISYYYGQHQASHISEAIGSATTKDRHQLITYTEPKIEDCFYRMLKPGEIKLAMAFDNDYVVLGSGKDQVKQLGNAVTPPAMEWLVQQVIESLN